VEGRDVAIEYRWAQGQYKSLPALAAELVRHPVFGHCRGRRTAFRSRGKGSPAPLRAHP